jgi:arylsulfatase A
MKTFTSLLLMLIPCIALGVEKPNIIFILSDDIGTGDIKCYYEPSKVTTTNIDKLAIQGMRFTQAYAPGSVCSP